MKARWLWARLALVGMLLVLANTAWSARLALVVGNQSYPGSGAFSLLSNPLNDANDMAGLFRDLDFDWVDLVQDASKSEFESAVSAFARQIQPGDSVVFYFSGHGISVAGINYLIPVPERGNGPLTNASQVQSDAVAISSVLDSISARNPAATLFLLDACRNEMKVSRRNGFESRGFSQMSANGALLAYASSPGETALGGAQSRNSLYTKHFLQQTRANPSQNIEYLLKQVRIAVAKESEGFQVPWVGSNLMTDLCLAPCGKREPIARLPAPEPAVVQPTVIEQPSAAQTTAQQSRTYTVGGVDFKLVRIPEGSFMMGSNNGDSDEKPVHRVSISSFYMMEHEVTFDLWDACVSDGQCERPKDQGWGRGTRPVINVSWNDITKQFIPWLNRKTGKTFRLPSESEWEYAARAGTTTKYSWGDSIGRNKANCDGCGSQWDDSKTAPVKSFSPNAFGLYDMHGNVWEWTQDCLNDSYNGAPSNNRAWESGDCERRVLRGGSWYDIPTLLRSANRDGYFSSTRLYYGGFRLVQAP